ncbi:MAG: NAD(P)-binding protein, partial [Pseudomonadales bacterium]
MTDPIEITGNDDEIRAALLDINLPTLLVVMTHFVGDDRFLTERYQPKPIEIPEGELFPDDSGGYTDEIAAEIREAAFNMIVQMRDKGYSLPPAPDLERMKHWMEFSTATPIEDSYCRMLLEETRFVDRDEQWRGEIKQAMAANTGVDFSVLIVGAGMSGICTAVKLKDAGVPYTIIEKNDAVGGTWYENTYPDCGVDTPNHFYSFSFERNPNWSGYFSKRDELYQYFESCTDKFGIRDNIQFESEVTGMHFDDSQNIWTVSVRRADGSIDALTANVVVSAVGQLNRPIIPEFEGLEAF